MNIVQRTGLQWLMNQEIQESVEIERMRMENIALASNPATSNEYVKKLLELRREDEQEDEPVWLTPSGPEDVDDIQAKLAGLL